MDTSQWPQGTNGVVRAVDQNTRPAAENCNRSTIITRPQKDRSLRGALNCPRCDSSNTKFCYYNNYSLSQPRYLCKTCKRYWTEGGNLRNVPVGGGSRRNKRPSSSISSKKVVIPNLGPPVPKISPDRENPKIHDEYGKTLNLDFNPLSVYSGMSNEFGGLPFGLDLKNSLMINPQNPNFCSSSFSNGNLPFSSLISMPVFNYDSRVHDFKPSLSFSLDHHALENGYGNNLEAIQLPILKPVSSTSDHQLDEQEKGQLGDHPNGYWNYGVMNGGSW